MSAFDDKKKSAPRRDVSKERDLDAERLRGLGMGDHTEDEIEADHLPPKMSNADDREEENRQLILDEFLLDDFLFDFYDVMRTADGEPKGSREWTTDEIKAGELRLMSNERSAAVLRLRAQARLEEDEADRLENEASELVALPSAPKDIGFAAMERMINGEPEPYQKAANAWSRQRDEYWAPWIKKFRAFRRNGDRITLARQRIQTMMSKAGLDHDESTLRRRLKD